MASLAKPEQLLETALNALRDGEWRAVLDALPAPVYTTDPDGAVTYWNQACVNFAGREPQLGSDRWCVTWQLYTMDGEFMPHDQCPMAEAVKTRKEVRDQVAIAMRPDGSRRAFAPYPTPLFDESGAFSGAVNLLIDVSEEQADGLSEQAVRCKRLSRAMSDSDAARILDTMSKDYEATASALRER
ncbi:MAG TPA: PAS domain-containing protein [Sphingomicrobium sp.]|nr:PAS domain-containing protein [Sphingomicrobium sp.]